MEYITASAQPTPNTKPRKTPIIEEIVKLTSQVYQRLRWSSFVDRGRIDVRVSRENFVGVV